MLSQKIAKNAILIYNDIDIDSNYKELTKSAREFNSFIEGMYNGDKDLKLKKTTDKDILKELDEVNSVWKPFYKSILSLYKNGKKDKKAYKYIVDNNEKLMRLSHKLTQTLQSKHILNTQDNQVKVYTLKIADRQRMLTQKMFKEKFLLYTNQDVERNRVRLRGSMILFKNGLNALIDGEDRRGTAKVTDKKIRAKLEQMKKFYTEVENIYKKQKVNLSEIKKLSNIDKELLNLSIDVVKMIENTLVY
jgi:predicted RND superfamily exporter protein